MKNRDEKLERLIKDDYMRAAAEEENVLLKDDSVVPLWRLDGGFWRKRRKKRKRGMKRKRR